MALVGRRSWRGRTRDGGGRTRGATARAERSGSRGGLSSDSFSALRRVQNERIADKMSALQERLRDAERKLEDEGVRQRALQRYIVASPTRGVVGQSRFAQALRKRIVEAARDPARFPVLIFGEVGLGKSNLASLIHYGSPRRGEPLIRVDCSRLDESASELFGRGKREGLLNIMEGKGTVILENVHKAPPQALPLLRRALAMANLSIDEDESIGEDGSAPIPPAGFQFPRLVLTAATRVPLLDGVARTIKVAPLRVRPGDVHDLAKYFMRQICTESGLASLSLSQGALRKLESFNYTTNEAELKYMLSAAVAQSVGPGAGAGCDLELGEEVFWMSDGSKRSPSTFTADLMQTLPLLRTFFRSVVWPQEINFKFTVWAYAFVVLYLFVGPQDRATNAALNAFWAWWWPGIFLVYPFLGRVWCSVCPFMIYGELVQRLRKATGGTLMRWNRSVMDEWGYLFMVSPSFSSVRCSRSIDHSSH